MVTNVWRCLRLEIFHVRLPFRLSFRHARAQRSANESLIVVAHGPGGTCGFGEAIPRDYLTGETTASCIQALSQKLWPQLKTVTLNGTTSPFAALDPIYLSAEADGLVAAYSALDLAVFDAWARFFRVPGSRLLGGAIPAASQALTATIGLGGGANLAALMARLYRAAGFRQFKLKLGDPNWQNDVARLTAVRQALGSLPLRVDVNGVWTPAETLQRAALLRAFGVTGVEQPVAKGDAGQWVGLEKALGLRLIADEQLCSMRDGAALIAAGGRSIWNIRLAKNGGFVGVRRLIALAQQHGIDYQLGALVGETSLLHAAARACLGLGTPLAMETSLPELLLRTEPFTGGRHGWRGHTGSLGAAPGLAVELNLAALARVTVARYELS